MLCVSEGDSVSECDRVQRARVWESASRSARMERCISTDAAQPSTQKMTSKISKIAGIRQQSLPFDCWDSPGSAMQSSNSHNVE